MSALTTNGHGGNGGAGDGSGVNQMTERHDE